jgi:hypothetical protein
MLHPGPAVFKSMRALAMALSLFTHGLCAAQQETLESCLNGLAADSRFAPLAGKLAMGVAAGTTPAMTSDSSLASNKELPVIAAWAAARAECLKAESRYGNALYRPPMQAFGIDAENKVMAATEELFNRTISYGEFNRRRQAIAEELRGKVADLRRQIQTQNAYFEQADRLAREREQMQRDIEGAERQAALARQQSEQALEAAARMPTRSSGPDGLRRRQVPPAAPYRNCYRFGRQLSCTGW